ncbi:MAG: chromate transporter [Rhodospirillales bacterium]|jgi:chromate transporter|nr:chromate transporter [Rhodospirillales bacterium]
MITVLLQLAGLFALLSVLAVGGGAGVIPEMQRAVVDVHHWMSGPQFLALFALSRSAPGPGSLIVVLIGQKAAGLAGGLVAGVAMFAPSSVLAYLVAKFWHRSGGSAAGWQARVERALAPVAVGLTLASGIALIRGTEHGWAAYGVTAAATVVLTLTELNPVAMTVAGAAVLLAAAGH